LDSTWQICDLELKKMARCPILVSTNRVGRQEHGTSANGERDINKKKNKDKSKKEKRKKPQHTPKEKKKLKPEKKKTY